MPKKGPLPKVVEKTTEEIDAIILEIKESTLSEATKSFVMSCIDLAVWVPGMLEQKNISLHRLRTLLFGKGYNNNSRGKGKNDKSGADKNASEEGDSSNANSDEDSPKEKVPNSKEDNPTDEPPSEPKSKKPGHGRMPHTVYENFTQVVLSANLKIGSPCPWECGGSLYASNPGIIVRVKGKDFAEVVKYEVEKIRCTLCGYTFSADIPEEVGTEKYDAAFKSWLILQKYYVAVPFYRQESFQRLLGFPLPDSTQWDLVEQAAGACYPVFNQLIFLAAQGKRIFNDDTRVKILEVMDFIKNNPDTERKGMNTTGIISELTNGHTIALFFNGKNHAGENLEKVLKLRSNNLSPILQMCDALEANIPKGIETILSNCLSHGFRKFKELVDYFPEESLTIMRLLSVVYKNDEKTKKMTDAERLEHHQMHSAPAMETLKSYLALLLDKKLVEPNSEMGKAVRYMQNHWEKLTRFLTVPGAAIDNNIVERALKVPIRNRKSAMFYKTCYSAHIGGMLTSLIYTCHLAQQNPHKYFIALQENKESTLKNPEQWLPWNYKETLTSLENIPDPILSVANQVGHSPPRGSPAAISA